MTIAHRRPRQGLELLLKKIKFAPIVSIQGPRQCGKSYLLRQLLPEFMPSFHYESLDRSSVRDFARSNPRSFLEQSLTEHFAIDEVQKVPSLFDEMKDIVDRKRRPGQFIISGSTEFSHETQITESLTGRLSRLRLYPFNVSESLKLGMNESKMFPSFLKKPRINRSHFLRYLSCGGLPGIFSVKSDSERSALFADWLKITVERDLHQLRKYKFESDFAMRILKKVAELETPSCAAISKDLRSSNKKVQKYLDAFKTLFTLIEVIPASFSSGKPIYYLTDVGLLSSLNSNFSKQLETWFYLELSSQMAYKDWFDHQLRYYQSPRGGKIHAVFEKQGRWTAIKIGATESLDRREFLIFESLRNKLNPSQELETIYLSGGLSPMKLENNIHCLPWESVC